MATSKYSSRSTVALLCIIALAAIPYVSGFLSERIFRTTIIALDRAPGVDIQTEFYTRGWLNSKAITRIKFPALGLRLNFAHSIVHGPINFKALEGDAPLFTLASISTYKSAQGRYAFNQRSTAQRLDTRINFDGSVRSSSTPFAYRSTDYDSPNLAIITGTGTAHMHNQNSGQVNSIWSEIRTLNIVDNRFQIALDDIFIRTSQHLESAVVSSETHLELGELSYTADELQLSIGGNWMQITSRRDSEQVLLRINGTAAQASWSDTPFSDIAYDITLHNVQNPADEVVDETRTPAENPLLALLLQLPPGTDIEIRNLEFRHKDRLIKGWLRASTPSRVGTKNNDFNHYFGLLTLQAEFTADEQLVFDLLESRTKDIINRTDAFGEMITFSDDEAAPLVGNSVASQLKILRTQRYLDYDGSHYSARIALRDGRFTINDKPLLLH